jgi:two-component system, LytTR family, response regulator
MSSHQSPLRVFLIDDEGLALKRLSRLLKATGKVEIVGMTTDSESAIEQLETAEIDALFLDIQMPELSGFELLSRLQTQPLIVFTTAFDQYALRAFEVNSIDYLLKPVEAEHLNRAINKLERLRGNHQRKDLREIVESVASALRSATRYPEKIASRSGDRVRFIDVANVTHFVAKDKLTYAVLKEKSFVVESSISDLEQKLDPEKFVRIHRSTLLNIDYVDEMCSWFAGGVVVKLKDAQRTELPVARDRVRNLKRMLGF